MLGPVCDGQDKICSHPRLRVDDDPQLLAVRLETGPAGPLLETLKYLIDSKNSVGVLKVVALE